MNGRNQSSANECGGVGFCCRTLGFAAGVLDEDLLEMKWLREMKRAELFAVPTGIQKISDVWKKIECADFGVKL